MTSVTHPYSVAAFYKFVPMHDLPAIRQTLQTAAADAGTCGTILIAPEGVNGTIAGTQAGIDAVLDAVRNLPGCADVTAKHSHADTAPFQRMKVRLKREIVTMAVPGLDPTQTVGTYVDARDWNALIDAPDVMVVDTRNAYEVEIGTFEGAVNPKTEAFRDLPAWVRRNLDPARHRRVAMFCTGGIRCEKSTALLKTMGFDEVYHLKGGILKYLEDIPAETSKWQGDCFVFDERVSVTHGLRLGTFAMCPGCGRAMARDAETCNACTETARTAAASRPQS